MASRDCANTNGRSQAIKEAWATIVLCCITEIWSTRNNMVFNDKPKSVIQMKVHILFNIKMSSLRMNKPMDNTVTDLCTLKNLGFQCIPPKTHYPTPCFWNPPFPNEILFCYDGAARGNSGLAGVGISIRNSASSFIAGLSVGLGICSNYMAEISAIIIAVEWVGIKMIENVCISSDSSAAISTFSKEDIPWSFKARWYDMKNKIKQIISNATFREANFTADSLAKHGCSLPAGTKEEFVSIPSFVDNIEYPNVPYYRV